MPICDSLFEKKNFGKFTLDESSQLYPGKAHEQTYRRTDARKYRSTTTQTVKFNFDKYRSTSTQTVKFNFDNTQLTIDTFHLAQRKKYSSLVWIIIDKNNIDTDCQININQLKDCKTMRLKCFNRNSIHQRKRNICKKFT